MATSARLAIVLVCAGFGFVCGGCSGCTIGLHGRLWDERHLAEYSPLPHHVPKNPGGLSFRFAMAHDVIHERYPKHGIAFHRERERLAREKLAKVDHNDRAAFPVIDDLATSLWGQGRKEEAIKVMRDKLTREKALPGGGGGKDAYTTYANLGTFLIHSSFERALAGDKGVRDRMREGIELVQAAVRVNPEAHFGRERWQAAHAEFLLAAMDDPGVLKKFDFLYNHLDRTAEKILEGFWNNGYGRANRTVNLTFTLTHYFRDNVSPEDPAHWARLNEVRKNITRVGWEEDLERWYFPEAKQVPFDEPALGIVGMWRQGSGPDPHFALALGEIMLRVGQRYIAWAAHERASRMVDRFWPDPVVQQLLRDHCRKRQGEIEALLLNGDKLGGGPRPPEEVAGLRGQFEAELTHGESYQRAYQEYEEKQIAAGKSISDDHFYNEFNAGREPIASPTGSEEWFARVSQRKGFMYGARQFVAWGLLAAGIMALSVALLLRRRAARFAASLGERGGEPSAR